MRRTLVFVAALAASSVAHAGATYKTVAAQLSRARPRVAAQHGASLHRLGVEAVPLVGGAVSLGLGRTTQNGRTRYSLVGTLQLLCAGIGLGPIAEAIHYEQPRIPTLASNDRGSPGYDVDYHSEDLYTIAGSATRLELGGSMIAVELNVKLPLFSLKTKTQRLLDKSDGLLRQAKDAYRAQRPADADKLVAQAANLADRIDLKLDDK